MPKLFDFAAWDAEHGKAAVEARRKRSQALKRLDEIDRLSLRSLRGEALGKGRKADRDRLAELESEAESLRATLNSDTMT